LLDGTWLEFRGKRRRKKVARKGGEKNNNQDMGMLYQLGRNLSKKKRMVKGMGLKIRKVRENLQT